MFSLGMIKSEQGKFYVLWPQNKNKFHIILKISENNFCEMPLAAKYQKCLDQIEYPFFKNFWSNIDPLGVIKFKEESKVVSVGK